MAGFSLRFFWSNWIQSISLFSQICRTSSVYISKRSRPSIERLIDWIRSLLHPMIRTPLTLTVCALDYNLIQMCNSCSSWYICPQTLVSVLVVDEDSFSDWSTDSCGWSDDDFGGDLDFTTPPLSIDSGAVDTNDQEIVRCICEVEEENDFMIQVRLTSSCSGFSVCRATVSHSALFLCQCEECLCWQHGTCMGLLEDNVPDRYTCYICRDPPGERKKWVQLAFEGHIEAWSR